MMYLNNSEHVSRLLRDKSDKTASLIFTSNSR